ncbi:hypothetical protein PV350_23555 [Streptomyces sp. PA03-6a]|nr:hypothetical protein [Streptomyces sp. PA03-6a]
MARADDLAMMRERLVQEIATAEGRDLAPLVRELRMVLTELDDVSRGEGVSVVDELGLVRQARRADAQGGEPPAVRHQRG